MLLSRNFDYLQYERSFETGRKILENKKQNLISSNKQKGFCRVGNCIRSHRHLHQMDSILLQLLLAIPYKK